MTSDLLAGSPPSGRQTARRRRKKSRSARAVVKRSASPKAGSALFYTTQNFDTSLAAWLLEHGADPNRDLKQGRATYMPDGWSTY